MSLPLPLSNRNFRGKCGKYIMAEDVVALTERGRILLSNYLVIVTVSAGFSRSLNLDEYMDILEYYRVSPVEEFSHAVEKTTISKSRPSCVRQRSFVVSSTLQSASPLPTPPLTRKHLPQHLPDYTSSSASPPFLPPSPAPSFSRPPASPPRQSSPGTRSNCRRAASTGPLRRRRGSMRR